MEERRSWEANSRSDRQIPYFLWDLRVHYRVQKSPPLVPIQILDKNVEGRSRRRLKDNIKIDFRKVRISECGMDQTGSW
jgi:hypothetical protein